MYVQAITARLSSAYKSYSVIAVGICIGIDTKNEAELLKIQSKAGLLAEEVFSTIRKSIVSPYQTNC
jgi:hypothetical protein